ncbi:hypothetical protein [Herbiconiux liangxiaofengii]
MNELNDPALGSVPPTDPSTLKKQPPSDSGYDDMAWTLEFGHPSA